MQVAIIGGTGFVGAYLIDALLGAGHSVATLVRPGSENKLHQAEKVRAVAGVLGDPAAIRELLKDSDAVIYNVGILRESKSQGITFEAMQYEGAATTVDIARELGVKRLLLMSANGVKDNGTPYQYTKYRAEQYALQSGLDVTVLRPSVIFGDPRGTMEFATQLRNDMVRQPVPAVDFGDVIMAPVAVEDVASAFVAVLEKPDSFGKTYPLAGPEVLTWKQMIARVGQAVGRDKWFVRMPIPLMKFSAMLFDWLPFFPVTRDQLTMLEEGNVADPAILESLTGIAPQSFSVENLAYLK